MMINARSNTSTMAVIWCEIPEEEWTDSEILLLCTLGKRKPAHIIVTTANVHAKMLERSPFRISNAGPPRYCPSFTSLYICPRDASMMADELPRKAIVHIQNTAPGPPMPIAVATPAILPVPTRPDIARAKAWNEDIPLFELLPVNRS